MSPGDSYDAGYANLLSLLADKSPKAPYETIYAGIAHYLAQDPIGTSFAASIISSPLWQQPKRDHLLALANAFSNAARIKMDTLSKRQRSFFDLSAASEFDRWLRNVLLGLEGGVPSLLTSALLGLLEGIHLSQRLPARSANARLVRDVEYAAILALTETIEMANPQSEWEREFTKHTVAAAPEDPYKSIIAVLARYQKHISSEALQKLDLFTLATRLFEEIQETFVRVLVNWTGNTSHSRTAPPNHVQRDDQLSPWLAEKFEDVPFNSKLLARIITIVGNAGTTRERKRTWDLLDTLAAALYGTCVNLDKGWSIESLTDSDTLVGEGSGSKQLWDSLKMLLFSTLMIQQAMLDVILFLPPVGSPAKLRASTLTGTILRTLFTLSTIIDSFGGVSSTGNDSRSFEELKKVFYTAIDIMAVDERESERLVQELIVEARSITGSQQYVKAKRAFVLACAEQFVAVLSVETLESYVIPFCEPHLSDSSIRDTFEASHSVILSIFATDADKSLSYTPWSEPSGKQTRSRSEFVSKLVPGYCQYLLQNAQEGGLTTPQLRLAYAALVRSTSARSSRGDRESASPMNENHTAYLSGGAEAKPVSEGAALTWYCIDVLLSHIATATRPRDDPGTRGSVQALRLTLISLVPCVNFGLLPKLLEAVEDSIWDSAEQNERDELVQAVHDEMLERVGDREREVTMQWWFALRKKLESSNQAAEANGASFVENRQIELQSRL